MEVPFLDLKSHHEPLRKEIDAAIAEVIDCNAFAGGQFVEKFEERFAKFCGVSHAVGVGSGTEALWFALLACGVGRDDEVITVPSSFLATAEAISFCGAKPVFVDIDERTYTMDAGAIAKAITSRTKAIIPVHLFGQTADMGPIMELARKHGLYVVEDACQAHGAAYNGRPAGSIGHAGCFSFYPGKNLGAFGEAGAVVTNDADLREKMQILRDHGQVRKYEHSAVGWNGRMDGIQAAVLQVKLKYLAENNERRRSNARTYHRALESVSGLVIPLEAENRKHVYHLYPIRVKHRDSLKQHLTDRKIGSGIHYPIPIHLQKAYDFLNLHSGSFAVAERCASEFLSLPMYPELTQDQIQHVCNEVKAWLLCSNRPQPSTVSI